MNPSTVNYLQNYIEQLQAVTTEADAYGTLSNWHFNTYRNGTLGNALADLNADLGLTEVQTPKGPTDDYMLRDNPATTAVGTLTGSVVVVSANPGFRATANVLETAFRRVDARQNAAFCRDIFERLPAVCMRRSPYWTAVLKLIDLCNQREPAGTPAALWARAAQMREAGGIDLLPFHSTKDRITPRLSGPYVVELLHEVAVETLKMALRLKPRILLVTSPQGAQLMNRLMAEVPDYTFRIHGNGPDPSLAQPRLNCLRPWQRLQIFAASADDPIVVTLGYQIFSGSVIPKTINYRPEAFAQVLKDPLGVAAMMNDPQAFPAFMARAPRP